VRYDIAVVGLGYIGLPTASVFATRGKQVYGLDVSEHVVNTINRGEIHIVEPDLDVLVQAAVGSGHLKAGLKPVPADVFIIAVPTPFHKGKGRPIPDLGFVESASRSIASVIENGALIILESTSPVGTTEAMREWILEERANLGLTPLEGAHYVHCPERILPGQMLRELVENARICGGLSPEGAKRARDLYRTFCVGEIHLTDARTAEMVKLTENASRDGQIAFANELSLVCDKASIDVWSVIELANHHPRVNILNPGPGVGGHCIAVDPWFLVDTAPDCSPLMQTARRVNDGKPNWVLQQVQKHAERFTRAKVACLGLAFKANVDDLRESPSLQIVEALADLDELDLFVCEPNIESLPDSLQRSHITAASAEDAINKADIVLLLVDHREFGDIDRQLLHNRTIIDTRGLWR
jgi:UDP-N-acetyl-D-mannosaminuronic acid dehydrogenase